jgi:hypothetical protein
MTRKNLFVWLAAVMAIAVSVPVAAQPASQTASEFYVAYRAAMAKAKAVEDLTPLMSKEMRAKIESTPAAERPKMFEFIKMMSSSMTNVKVLKETQTAEGVTLTVEGMDGKEKMNGQVRVVKENGAWKMGRESWSNK